MKQLILGLLMIGWIGCTNMPGITLTSAQGDTIAVGINRVAYIDQDGHNVDCLKEADVWKCGYKDKQGNVVVIDNIDVDFLEGKKDEQSK